MADEKNLYAMNEKIVPVPIEDEMRDSYIDYAMSVIVGRALPDVRDGLKPVHRRILFAMNDLGLAHNKPYRKSARIVGEVLGKYHPHGDTSVYDSLVRMVQDFSLRYPLIDGQGNWGSPDDPKSFAAYRYTESRLTPYANTLLSELGQGTVEWLPTFDGSREEPRLLPARLPNILVNGTTGIAVGMATDIPPHNLRELAAACVHLLKTPNAHLSTLCEMIPGPDFPSGCEIISPPEELRAVYETGNGQIRARAKWEEEDGNVVITALPHQVSGSKIQEQIAEQINSKKLPLVTDIRDESDHENPTRLVIIPRSNRVDLEQLMAHLFATTELERTYRVNLNMIGLDGRPRVKNLKEILLEWLDYRVGTVRKRLQYRLQKVADRLHILDGLMKAFLNLDEVIRIIRTEEEPKPVLMKRFKLTEIQVEAILETKLRHLARLEEMQIKAEQKQLAEERANLEELLKSDAKLKKLIGDEIKADAEKHGDARRCKIVQRPAAQALEATAIMPTEPITVVLSKAGWIRAAKGHDINPVELDYKAGDEFLSAAQGRTNQLLILLDSKGRAYTLPAHDLPSARGHGEPVTSRLDLQDAARVAGVVLGDAEDRVVLGADNGYGFVAKLGELQAAKRAGKGALNVSTDASALAPAPIRDLKHDRVAMVTAEGRLLVFPIAELPELTRGKGNKLVALRGEDRIVAWTALPAGATLVVESGKRFVSFKPSEWKEYEGSRASRGSHLPRGYQTVQSIRAEIAKP